MQWKNSGKATGGASQARLMHRLHRTRRVGVPVPGVPGSAETAYRAGLGVAVCLSAAAVEAEASEVGNDVDSAHLNDVLLSAVLGRLAFKERRRVSCKALPFCV